MLYFVYLWHFIIVTWVSKQCVFVVLSDHTHWRFFKLFTQKISEYNYQSKKDGSDQESIQSSTTPGSGYHMRK